MGRSPPSLRSTPCHCGQNHNTIIHTPFLQKPTYPQPIPQKPCTFKSNPPHVLSLALLEAKSILGLALPMAFTGILLYSRSMVSMLFLGRLGPLALAGGSLAIGFTNITGYSLLFGLSMGMDPICSQAFGANKNSMLMPALHKTIILLLAASLPIALLWLNVRPILLLFGQDEDIARTAECYILSSIPDLVLQSFIHPLRIYLRTQSITTPIIYCAAVALVLHVPINFLHVSVLGHGVRGIALAGVWTNFNFAVLLMAYIYFFGPYESTSELKLIAESFSMGWKPLLSLTVSSSMSVCLEWWWYEIMVLLCGLLQNPKTTVASMGILIQTTSLIYILPSSLSYSVSTKVGHKLGAGQPDAARRSAAVGMSFGLALGLMAMGFTFAVRNTWAWMFTGDSQIAALTATVLPILGACELGNCPQTAGCGVLRGSARQRVGANINVCSFYLVGMPVAVGMAFWGRLDFRGLWLGLLAAQLTCVVLVGVVLGSTDWGLQAERAQRLTREFGDGGVLAAVDEDEKPSLVIQVNIEQSGALTSAVEV